MKVSITPLTPEAIFRRACEMTPQPGKTSRVSLAKMLHAEHSPIRTLRFWVEIEGLPSFVSVHFVRHKIGVEHFVQSMRDDRGGGPAALVTRETPVRHGMEINAQALIAMSRKRLCLHSHRSTVAAWARVRRAMMAAQPAIRKFVWVRLMRGIIVIRKIAWDDRPMNKFRVLDLFSGIGGFSLGLERTGGFETVAFCEIDPFCRRVLAKHWPPVKQYEDVRELTAERLAADGLVPVDVICGGFPCQDISDAGNRAGLAGERSGLWSEIARLAGELRPRYVIVENVAALLGRGLDAVLGDLAALGYDAEWHCIPAAAVGAPHRRDRIWIVAYPAGERPGEARQLRPAQPEERSASSGQAVTPPDAARVGRREDVLHVEGTPRLGSIARLIAGTGAAGGGVWVAEPNVGRVAHGVPFRVDRLRSLGNSVVPQIPELIGRAILSWYRVSAPEPPLSIRERITDQARTWKVLHRFLRLKYQPYR